jgi:hypothetical protein
MALSRYMQAHAGSRSLLHQRNLKSSNLSCIDATLQMPHLPCQRLVTIVTQVLCPTFYHPKCRSPCNSPKRLRRSLKDPKAKAQSNSREINPPHLLSTHTQTATYSSAYRVSRLGGDWSRLGNKRSMSVIAVATECLRCGYGVQGPLELTKASRRRAR